jgi:hypothetical protein
MTRHIKRGGRIWIRIFPDKPISHKPAEVRMGNGKGSPEYFVAEIQPGKVLYEMDGVDEVLARQAFSLAAAKLPIQTTFVIRQVGGLHESEGIKEQESCGIATGVVGALAGTIRPAHAICDPAVKQHQSITQHTPGYRSRKNHS